MSMLMCCDCKQRTQYICIYAGIEYANQVNSHNSIHEEL